MIDRPFWKDLIELNWKNRSILWLSGVRRVGKTSLCLSLPNVVYYDCERPRVRMFIESEAEGFLEQHQNQRLVLDEIHRLANPSELLKIAADHYPDVKIIATGSSSLSASTQFRDTLAGRKFEIWLTPLLWHEWQTFGTRFFSERFLKGGLPPFLMAKDWPEHAFREWLDAFWAKDIQELFRVEKRMSFLRFAELLWLRSGGIFEATRFAKECEVSRQTISNYLSILETSYVVHILRPFSHSRAHEIISAPKIYGFDTGFVCYAKGWNVLRQEDYGVLWEHCVLNELQGHLQRRDIYYWRDKQKHEIDFIVQTRKSFPPVAIECKWVAKEFEVNNLKIFRFHYPEGDNFVVANDIETPFTKNMKGIQVQFVNLKTLTNKLTTTS